LSRCICSVLVANEFYERRWRWAFTNLDKNDDDKEKKDAEAEEEEQRKKKEEEELKLKKDAADQNSLNVTPASVDVKDSPTKNESQNTPESTKNKPKGQQRWSNLEVIKFILLQ